MLTPSVAIEEYVKGDAFQRWLVPGVGSTVLEVHAELREADRPVGAAAARRPADAGGGYTIGAWKSIFGQIAGDLTEDVSAQLRK